MIRVICIFIISLSTLLAQKRIHSFYVELNVPLLSQMPLENGFEESVFYDNLIKGNEQSYHKGYYNTKWKNLTSNYSLFSFIYFQNKQNWFLGFKSKNFNTEQYYNRFYLNDDMDNLYKYQKIPSWSSFSYYDLFYGEKFIYKGFSVFPYLSVRSNYFSNHHFSVPFLINIKGRNNYFFRSFFSASNYRIYLPDMSSSVDKFLTSVFLIDTLSNIPLEKFIRESKSYTLNFGYKAESKISNSVSLSIEMSFYLFSIGKGYAKDNFLSYEKREQDTYYFGKSQLDYNTKISNYEIGLNYTIYKDLNLLLKFSYDVFDSIYTNYKGSHIKNTEKEISIPLNEIFTNTFFYNQSYKSYSSNISLGVNFKI